MKPTPSLRAVALFGLAALLTACGDDPERPDPVSPWREAAFEEPLQGGAILGIAFSATRGIAVGAVASGAAPEQTFGPFLLARQEDGAWARDSGVSLPAQGMLLAAGIEASGDAVVAGIDHVSPTGFVLDERGGWSRHDVAFGALAFAASGDTLRFGGAAGGNQQIVVSTSSDVWTLESLPYPTGGEHGIEDVAAGSGHWAACGFDDGGDGTPESPNSVLFRDQGTGWERIGVECGGCTNAAARTGSSSRSR